MHRLLVLAEGTRFFQDLSAAAAARGFDWNLVLATRPEKAAQALTEATFDAVICTERLRNVSGQHLLNEISRRHPDVLRILVAEGEESVLALGSLACSHHVLTTPCNVQQLSQLIERAQKLRELMSSSVVTSLVSRLKKLPTYPATYAELTTVMERRNFSISQVTAVVRRDAMMVAKILQVANSAFFGFSRTVSSIDLAVSLLGSQLIRNIVLANEVFSQYDPRLLSEFRMDLLWEHSFRVSTLSSRIARELSLSRRMCDEAFAAGILHDIGKLALIANVPDEYRRVQELAQSGLAVDAAEREVLGASHAELGAFLLGLWDLPENIVEAVAYHHTPLKAPSLQPGVLTAVCFANWADNTRAKPLEPAPAVEGGEEYARKLHLEANLGQWLTPGALEASGQPAVS